MWTANRAGAALLTGALIVLVFVLVVFRRAEVDYANLESAADRLHEAIDATAATLSALKDAETGQRGYLLTADDSYLEPYRAGLRDYRESLAKLRGRTASDPTLAGMVHNLGELGERKLSWMADSVRLCAAGHRAEAVDRVGQDVGKHYMDDIRELVARMIHAEEMAYTQTNQRIAGAERTVRRRVLIAAAVFLETEVEKRTEDLQELNRELPAFSWSVSHDLRAPLRSIDGFSQIVLEDYSDRLDDAGRDMLKRIRAGAKRVGQVIQSLLELSRVTRVDLHRERVSISRLAESVVKGLRAASPGRQVRVDIAPGLDAEGDPQLLRVVMENLLANAWKFTSQTRDARIEVGSTRREGKPGLLRSRQRLGLRSLLCGSAVRAVSAAARGVGIRGHGDRARYRAPRHPAPWRVHPRGRKAR